MFVRYRSNYFSFESLHTRFVSVIGVVVKNICVFPKKFPLSCRLHKRSDNLSSPEGTKCKLKESRLPFELDTSIMHSVFWTALKEINIASWLEMLSKT